MKARGRTVLVLGVAVVSAAIAYGWLWLGRSEVDGIWSVRFDETEGVLALRSGGVYAHCYGENVQLGTFQVEDGVLELLVRFLPSMKQPVEYTGKIEWEGDGFEMDRGEDRRWVFQPYEGDCSELPAKLRSKSASPSGAAGPGSRE